MTQLEMRALVDELNRASVLYYTRGDSPMSDAEWDQKYNQLLQMEKESGMVLPDSPSHRVGAEPLKNFEQHKHISRLWSMGARRSSTLSCPTAGKNLCRRCNTRWNTSWTA